MKIAVIGGGAWGTALAILAARHEEHDVRLWARSADDVETMRRERVNRRYLPEVELPPALTVTGERAEAVDDAAAVLFVVPSQAFRQVVVDFSPLLRDDAILVSATKGIEHGSLLRMTTVLTEVRSHNPIAALSGPSFALEVAQGEPTAAVVAAPVDRTARRIQEELSDGRFRLYSTDDVVGVEIAAALKNVMAIATGIVAGMGLGHNVAAAIMTRGLRELSRLGDALGGREETFAGLAGMGDLVLTCTGGLSRNRQVGMRLGQGEELSHILETMGHVAEGVRTTSAALELAATVGVELPLVTAVSMILDGKMTPSAAIDHLMTRTLKSETS